jgi:hypothetical protein
MPSPGPTLSTAMLDAAIEMIGRAGVRGSVAVAGVSMHPTFAAVERLAVEFAPGKISFGDVIVFRQRGKLVVHRLVGRERAGSRLKTRGDGTISFDPWVEHGDVIGRVFAVEYPGDEWRGIRGGRASFYGGCLAAHDLCWGLLGSLALKIAGEGWRWRIGRLDHFKLTLVHGLLFRAFNPRIAPPELDAGSGAAEARCYTRSLDPAHTRKKPNQQ